jgi:ABC-type branched-subunit amino acid transport system ATPase component
MIATLLQQLDSAITILIIEHDMDVAFAWTQSIMGLHYGRIIADGLADERVLGLCPRLQERIASRAGTLSGGEQQTLATGRALMTNPDLLLMDKPIGAGALARARGAACRRRPQSPGPLHPAGGVACVVGPAGC